MTIESLIGITSGLLAIGGAAWGGFKLLKKQPLTALMNELADKSTTLKRQHKILGIINKRLVLSRQKISATYIKGFHSSGRSKLAIFYDICNENHIEPTPEICRLLLGADEPKFRNEWTAEHVAAQDAITTPGTTRAFPESSASIADSDRIVYLSSLLAERFPGACNRLTAILNKHHVPFAFLEGTKDIWCRDYMPVQTPSGKLLQFRYNPSYLDAAAYSSARSDVRHVDEVNGLTPVFSEINLDGGNVVMYGSKAIITDRVFSENPDWPHDRLLAQLAKELECELIVIPAYKPEYDFTGHADGMIRFVDENTVLVNNLEQDFVYMKNGIVKALDAASLKYINFPFFEHKIKGNDEHAIGIYLNYLEVGNLIVVPVFGVEGNKDAEAVAMLKEIFPTKCIETIDYNDVALKGGLLNCTTWVKNITK